MKDLIISKMLTLTQQIDDLIHTQRMTDSEAHKDRVHHAIELLQAKREVLAELFDEVNEA